MEEIKNMLDETGNFNIEQIQTLLDELVYNYDINEENEIDKKNFGDDLVELTKMYNDYNRKLPELSFLIKQIYEKIKKLDQKKERLNGRASRRDIEDRQSFEKQLMDLKRDYEEIRNNRNEAKQKHIETKIKYEEACDAVSKKAALNAFNETNKKLKDICKFIMVEMIRIENNMEIALNDLNSNKSSDEQSNVITNFLDTKKEKDTLYNNYKNVLDYISNSDEYQSTVSEDIVEEIKSELKQQFEQQNIENLEKNDNELIEEKEGTKDEAEEIEKEDTKDEAEEINILDDCDDNFQNNNQTEISLDEKMTNLETQGTVRKFKGKQLSEEQQIVADELINNVISNPNIINKISTIKVASIDLINNGIQKLKNIKNKLCNNSEFVEESKVR